MNEFANKSGALSPKQLEKAITTEIVTHLACLLVAESPMKTELQQLAQKLRGQILAELEDQQTRDAFLDSRNILMELARLLTRCQDRQQLAKALSYIKALNAGEVMIAADDPREGEMRQRLIDYCNQKLLLTPWEQDITDIINIVRFVDHDPINQ